MGSNLDTVQGTVVLVITMERTLLNSTLDTMVSVAIIVHT